MLVLHHLQPTGPIMRLALLLLLITTTAGAQTSLGNFNWRNPESRFTVPPRLTDQTQRIRWIAVDDVNATCNMENIRRTGKPIGYNVQGCQFMENHECIIITPKITTIHNLGHEALHCFVGNYH